MIIIFKDERSAGRIIPSISNMHDYVGDAGSLVCHCSGAIWMWVLYRGKGGTEVTDSIVLSKEVDLGGSSLHDHCM